MKVFVRRDSRAIIRKEFGVAGASYLEISRGTGEPLDWEYAVIKARAEQAPTESMGELLTELRTRVMPIMEDTQRLLANMNTITGAIAGGEGAVGRLLAEDRIVVQVEKILDRLDASFAQLPPILQSLRASAGDLSTLSAELAELAGGVPQLSRRTGEILASLQSVTSDLSRTTPKLPGLIENVDDATGDLPVLLVQTREALSELTRLLQQLQSHWLLGGRKKRDAKTRDRISPLEVSP
jgi:phospholipid/cholesterol/gamma-HCH transport system substrate-binding protein